MMTSMASTRVVSLRCQGSTPNTQLRAVSRTVPAVVRARVPAKLTSSYGHRLRTTRRLRTLQLSARSDQDAPNDDDDSDDKTAEGAKAEETAASTAVEDIEEEEEEYEIVPTMGEQMKTMVTTQVPAFVQQPAVKNTLIVGAVVLGGTFLYSVYQVVQRWRAPKAKRSRTLNKNKFLVEELSTYLPDRRQELTQSIVGRLSWKTGFSSDLIFRKYLRFHLDQRSFDMEAMADLLHLKATCRLSDEEVVELVLESARRTFERTGVLMMKPEGMSAKGLQRKATGRALFSKLMYLADSEEFLPTADREALQGEIKEVFGATSEDAAELRIASLTEMDLERLEQLTIAPDEQDAPDEQGESSEQDPPGQVSASKDK